jgi:hypothetical protein
MTMPLKTLSEINQEAIRVLSREIGLANTIRFINQFTSGSGNYTEDRRATYAELSLEDLVSEIKKRRADRE